MLKKIFYSTLTILLSLSFCSVFAKQVDHNKTPQARRLKKQELAMINKLNTSQELKDFLVEYLSNPRNTHLLLKLSNVTLVGPTGSSVATPIAYGADYGIISAAATYIHHWAGTRQEYGSLGFGFGLGNAKKNVGVSVSMMLDNVNPATSGFGDSGTFAFQLFHIFPNNFAIAAGIGNSPIAWGDFKHVSRSFYVVATKVIDLRNNEVSPLPLTVSAGLGTGAFANGDSSNYKSDANIRPFISAGLRVLPWCSLIGELAAQRVDAGVSLIPFAKLPIAINLSALNLVNDFSSNPGSYNITIAAGYAFA